MTRIVAIDIFESLSYINSRYIEEADADRLRAVKPRISKTARAILIAAILAAFLTACAVGYSIHQRRQQELREKYEVTENNIDAWEDYNVSLQDNAATCTAPKITLLSQYNDGVFCTVFINVSPVEESEVVMPTMVEQLEDGRFHRLAYRFAVQGGSFENSAHFFWDYEGEYEPEDYVSDELINVDGKLRPKVTAEARYREMKKQCYDPATKTATFRCPILLDRININEPISLELALWDSYHRGDGYDTEDFEIENELRRSFGTISFNIIPQQVCAVSFENPPEFCNEKRDKSGYIRGVDISATQIIWRFVLNEQEDALDTVSEERIKTNEQFEISLSWSRCIDQLLKEATLNFEDGTSLQCGGAVSYKISDGELDVTSYHTMQGKGETTIDIHKLDSVTISGQIFQLPPVVDVRG